MTIKETVQNLLEAKHHLKDNLIGLEKEALRVLKNGNSALTPHPKKLGSALTNPAITTDFSENLLEIITPPLKGAKNVLNYLKNIEYFVNQSLNEDEILWHQSMPCLLPENDQEIPLAQYGNSNSGKMKTVYRRGLGLRYGRKMQMIAGIHFNYSFSESFLTAMFEKQSKFKTYQDFVNDSYMALSRNVLRYGWLLTYLFGASPVISKTFLSSSHQLEKLNDKDLFEQNATSLRMGDIGYQNAQDCEFGVKVNYNTLDNYINSLQKAMNTHCSVYAKKGLKKEDKYQQLSNNILQIENEYYNNIRPKQLNKPMQTPSNALKEKGILYIECRTLDVNPLLEQGIDEEQILFLEVFLLFCLLEKSPEISLEQQLEINENDKKVAHFGREKLLKLSVNEKEISLLDYAKNIVEQIKPVLDLLSEEHKIAFDNIIQRITNNEELPSFKILEKIKNKDFIDFNLEQSRATKQSNLTAKIDEDIQEKIKTLCENSVQKQLNIEATDDLTFTAYLTEYFKKA